MVPQRVVDFFEPIEVHHDHADRLAAAPRRDNGVLQAIEKQRAIRQSGQTVVGGLVDDLLLALGDTGAHAVEGHGQIADLVVLLDRHVRAVVAHLDLLRPLGQAAQRTDDAAREVHRGQDGHH